MTTKITRRTALKAAAATLAAPAVFRSFAHAAPSDTLLHVSVGAGGMAAADISSLTSHKKLKLVAVADVDDTKAAAMKKKFPDIETFRDWREMFDKVKFDSANVSTPDHMHACPTMRAIQAGKAVYTQKHLPSLCQVQSHPLAPSRLHMPTHQFICPLSSAANSQTITSYA